MYRSPKLGLVWSQFGTILLPIIIVVLKNKKEDAPRYFSSWLTLEDLVLDATQLGTFMLFVARSAESQVGKTV